MKKLFFILPVFALNSTAQAKDYFVNLGSQLRLPLSSNKIWIENGKVIKAEAIGHELQIKGLSEGQSKIKTGEEYDTVYVLKSEKMSFIKKATQIVNQTVGLQISAENDQVTITGHLYRWQDWQKFILAAQNLFSSYELKAQIEESLKTIASTEINKSLKRHGLQPVNILFGQTLETRLPSKIAYSANYKKILNQHGVRVILDDESVDQSPTVKVQITVAEVRRDFSRKLGIKWPASYDAHIINPTDQFDSFDLSAQFFEQNGIGKILASPNIICKSGKEAEFLAGGEFPIKILNYKMQDVVWKKYGILLHVKPKADLSGRMSITLDTEVSTIDSSRSVDGIPGLLTNKVSSTFDLNEPKTIALSGLLKKEDSTKSEGLPFLSTIPILGPLFSSKDYNDNRTELIIFVRPEIIDNDRTNTDKAQHLVDVLE